MGTDHRARILVVHGVAKYLNKVKLSNLPKEDSRPVPLYINKSYKEDESKSDKYLAKANWYKSKPKSRRENESESWERDLKGAQHSRREESMEWSLVPCYMYQIL